VRPLPFSTILKKMSEMGGPLVLKQLSIGWSFFKEAANVEKDLKPF
jgi:hypothetical protein